MIRRRSRGRRRHKTSAQPACVAIRRPTTFTRINCLGRRRAACVCKCRHIFRCAARLRPPSAMRGLGWSLVPRGNRSRCECVARSLLNSCGPFSRGSSREGASRRSHARGNDANDTTCHGNGPSPRGLDGVVQRIALARARNRRGTLRVVRSGGRRAAAGVSTRYRSAVVRGGRETRGAADRLIPPGRLHRDFLLALEAARSARMQDELLRAPVQQLGDVELVLGWARDLVDPAELLQCPARAAEPT